VGRYSPDRAGRVTWSRHGGAVCIRLAGLAGETNVQVRLAQASGAALTAGVLPAMAGSLVRDGHDLCFVPRFAFIEGSAYTVTAGGADVAVLVRPRAERPAVTEVIGIWPTAAEVPRNLLRLYVQFSAPMSEGQAARHVQLTDDAGWPLAGALLPTEYELWDAARCRLTVLLDPARIKRGLVAHRKAGYPLQPGKPFQVVVGDGFLDASGARLRVPARRRYQVGSDERRHVDVGAWTVSGPVVGSASPLQVTFDRPLDHGLLGRCLRVTGPDGRPVDGIAETGEREHSWRLLPRQPWAAGQYQLAVDPALEDPAGNSITRIFDQDLTSAADEPWPAREPAQAVLFQPR
jgi:hypothetical protein